MQKREFRKVAAMHKIANMRKTAGPGDWPTIAAAAVLTVAFMGGALGGAVAGKVTEPSEHDMQNLQKEYELSRLHRDNQTQQILAAREDAERQMRGNKQKAMRIG